MATTLIVPSNPEDIKKINGNLQEIADAMTRIAAERELIKDIKAVMKEDFDLPPKYISKLVKTYYNQDFDTQEVENEDFCELWETINLKKGSTT